MKQTPFHMFDTVAQFDMVPHKRLLHKLKSFGISVTLLKWIKNFHTNRKQSVVVNGTFSDLKLVSSGIPQGSVLD